MAEFKYEAERILRDLKSLLDEAVKFEDENAKLKKEIQDMEKRHAADMTAATKK